MWRLDFQTTSGGAGDFEDRLLRDGADSVTTRPEGPGGVFVSAIFSDSAAAGPWLGVASFIEEMEESAWRYRWLEDFNGYELNGEVYIYPVTSSAPLATRYRHTVYIDPRDAFGDGRHPTTSMCLSMIYDLLAPLGPDGAAPLSVLDVGAGTGILSILASFLGAGSVEAIDIDETSVEMARRNIALNRCGHVALRRCGIEEYRGARRFDIVAANLLYGIIAENIDRILALVKPGGRLITSGLSVRWEREVEALFREKGLEVKEKRMMEDWLAYLLTIKK